MWLSRTKTEPDEFICIKCTVILNEISKKKSGTQITHKIAIDAFNKE